ncbi:hypothetical protein TTHERM_000947427 (macronuclear) [Tetrahymena thermophila SB210]|uniref:Uncharacterized protein n=1 Tax=Tetrahymena thermophila (strain SB210) TaxID=312017 RepID=W7X6A9_TETTS|nr:hypothetical protein TTHERM_000947427 [Tetrahymena thermophila SB210]EWS71893.1 hypothetical protein TTHERM_000947427 [Tetrahymena thermophila SB210]|eukprot:XP_012655571.1 hypothetical protein TTHERM_000947427 [Tetrahymena thermophila SB210]
MYTLQTDYAIILILTFKLFQLRLRLNVANVFSLSKNNQVVQSITYSHWFIYFHINPTLKFKIKFNIEYLVQLYPFPSILNNLHEFLFHCFHYKLINKSLQITYLNHFSQVNQKYHVLTNQKQIAKLHQAQNRNNRTKYAF